MESPSLGFWDDQTQQLLQSFSRHWLGRALQHGIWNELVPLHSPQVFKENPPPFGRGLCVLCSPVVLRQGGCRSLGWGWREERTVGIQSGFRCADRAEGILTLLSFSLLSSSISVCYTCSPLHRARTLTEGKGREGVGEGIKKISL